MFFYLGSICFCVCIITIPSDLKWISVCIIGPLNSLLITHVYLFRQELSGMLMSDKTVYVLPYTPNRKIEQCCDDVIVRLVPILSKVTCIIALINSEMMYRCELVLYWFLHVHLIYNAPLFCLLSNVYHWASSCRAYDWGERGREGLDVILKQP